MAKLKGNRIGAVDSRDDGTDSNRMRSLCIFCRRWAADAALEHGDGLSYHAKCRAKHPNVVGKPNGVPPSVVVVQVAPNSYQFMFRVELATETVWVRRYTSDTMGNNVGELHDLLNDADRASEVILYAVDDWGTLPPSLTGRVL